MQNNKYLIKLKRIILLLISIFILNSGHIYGKDKFVAAYFIDSEDGDKITSVANVIIKDNIKGEAGLTWLIPSEVIEATDVGGIFIKPDIDSAEEMVSDYITGNGYRYLVEYKIQNTELRDRKNLSVPYILNRFSKYYKVLIDYRIINPQSTQVEFAGSFSYKVDVSDNAQFFEYDPWRADILIDAVLFDDIIDIAAEKASAIIISQMKSLNEGGLLALK
ncbi:MAG: hypothetical protein GY855_11630 [candidate division Zixibacteria bacterium]|nr:hypothetical protein [candidate division Zixibacteria bacterium]